MAERKIWTPPIVGKQWEIFNVGVKETITNQNVQQCVLVSGSRWSGKTYGTLYRVVRHLWETRGARVAMFAKYMKNLTDGGSFVDLVMNVIPVWVESGITGETGLPFEFTTIDSRGLPGPKTDAKTRTIYFRVRNMYGGESELRLFSLVNENEVASRLKNLTFSMIYFSELTNFKNHEVVRASMMQLRFGHLKPWQHMFIADTNPAEEGEDSWVYKYWFLRKRIGQGQENADSFFGSLKLIQLYLNENPLMSEEQRKYLESMYDDDPGAFDRDILGKWTKGHGTKGKHFADLYSPAVHVIGGGAGEGDMIDVLDTATELVTSSDIGASINHATVFFQRRIIKIGDKEYAAWDCLDELVSIGERLQIEEYVAAWLEKMRYIEERFGRKFNWTHYADDSAINVFRNAGEGTDALEIEKHSNGQIQLIGVAKPKYSVRSRVRLLRRFLKQQRTFISARCEKVQQMLRECREGTTQEQFVAWDENRHVFDAYTYGPYAESVDELVNEVFRPTASSTPVSELMVSVPL